MLSRTKELKIVDDEGSSVDAQAEYDRTQKKVEDLRGRRHQ